MSESEKIKKKKEKKRSRLARGHIKMEHKNVTDKGQRATRGSCLVGSVRGAEARKGLKGPKENY